ncbi:mitochondrial ribosomal protein subunit L20-domain-containing protein [Piptocephalis cylindrospora]|uniref:Mitochondrial ribosomal protein subunit L20-domain-containing protein n=1 Tax=Piptocephalis cylindrospora TaxID=1907219 RepID=A0A4P9Y7A7_9FUNG|nr:mitochondrial ribosomal protein subunit L20-domain-containing protein [Piptocephalis cylindrospora]|eukprot:RKP14702.1 mitochondrial ribosomal protein subunit L20-domain-containing protein [Piptocephalis cylindrospora]
MLLSRAVSAFVASNLRSHSTMAKSSAPAAAIVYERTILPDGAEFVSRVPTSATRANAAVKTQLPPPLKEIKEKLYHLTDADRQAIRALRAEDPEKWTCRALAAKFKCTPFYISIVAKSSPEHQAKIQADLERIREKHGYKRRQIIQNRIRRKALW